MQAHQRKRKRQAEELAEERAAQRVRARTAGRSRTAHVSLGEGHPLAEFVGQCTHALEYPDGATKRQAIAKGTWTHANMDGSNFSGPCRAKSPTPGRNPGTFRVPVEKRARFFELMAQCVDGGVHDMCFSEKGIIPGHNNIQRACADLDLKTRHRKGALWKLDVVIQLTEALSLRYPDAPRSWFVAYVLMRPETKTKIRVQDREVSAWNGGVHVVWPNLQLTYAKLRLVREDWVNLLEERLPFSAGEHQSWGKIVDEKISELRMPFCKKARRCSMCKGKGFPDCRECSGQGTFIVPDSEYRLHYILKVVEDADVDGVFQMETDKATMRLLLRQTALQLQMTCISTSAVKERDGFVLRPGETLPEEDEDEAAGLGAPKLKGKAPEMLESDSIKAFLAQQIERMHPRYKGMRLKAVQVIRSRGKEGYITAYNMYPRGKYPCMNLVPDNDTGVAQAHNNANIYFEVQRRDGVFRQRCLCKCDAGIGQGRVSGPCRDARCIGDGIHLTATRRLQLFSYPPREARRQLRSAQLEMRTDYVSSPNEHFIQKVQGLEYRLHLALFNRLPLRGQSISAAHACNALSAFLQSADPRPMSLEQSEEEVRRANMRLEYITQAVSKWGEKMVAAEAADNAVELLALREEARRVSREREGLQAVVAGTAHIDDPASVATTGQGPRCPSSWLEVDKDGTGGMRLHPPRPLVCPSRPPIVGIPATIAITEAEEAALEAFLAAEARSRTP